MVNRQRLSTRLRRIMDDGLIRRSKVGVAGVFGLLLIAAVLLPGLKLKGAPADRDRTPTAASSETGVKQNRPSADHRISGRLLDAKGQPVEGGRVWLMIRETWSGGLELPTLAEADSGPDGRFSLDLPGSRVSEFVMNKNTKVEVWVHTPKHRLTRVVTAGSIPGQIGDVQLADAPSFEVRIKHPRGKPFVDSTAEVASARFNKTYASLPVDIRPQMRFTVQADGRLQVRGITAEELVSLTITTPDLGVQEHADYGKNATTKEVALLDVGAIEGRLVAPSGAEVDLSQVSVRVATLRNDDSAGSSPMMHGTFSVMPDAGGRFLVPRIAEGVIRLFVTEPDDFPYRAVTPRGLTVDAGRTTRVEIPIRAAVKTTGLIQEEDTKRPIPGVRVLLQDNFQHYNALTDIQGKYALWLLPNIHYHVVHNLPGNFIPRNISRGRSIKVPKGQNHELEPVEFLRGRSLMGEVVDADGNPMANIRVGADWHDPREDFGMFAQYATANARVWATSDENGQFQLERLHPTAEWSLVATRAGVRLTDPLPVAAGHKEPIRLTSKRFDYVSLTGRVVDQDKRPLGGVDVTLYVWTKDAKEDQQTFGLRLTTQEDGRFQTPEHLPREYSYRVSVRENNEEITSKWFAPLGEDSTVLPDLVVKRAELSISEAASAASRATFDLRRTVVDDSGKAIDEARIVTWFDAQRQRRAADSSGSFTLSRLPHHGGWLFVLADGYRTHGEYVTPETPATPIVLVRVNEPANRPFTTRKAAEPNDQVLALAREELAKFVDTVMNEQDDKEVQREKTNLHRLQARLDPNAALQLLDDKRLDLSALAFSNSDTNYAEWHANRIRTTVAVAIAKDDLPRALEIAEQMGDIGSRMHALLSIAKQCNESERAAIIQSAIDLPAKDNESTWRIEQLATLGASCLAISDTERARQLFDTAAANAAKLGFDGRAAFSRGYLAWSMAPIDQQTALSLIDGIKPNRELDRCHRNIAHQLADVDTELSESLLEKVSLDLRDEAAMRVSSRMAGLDLARAKRIADGMGDISRRAYAIGSMALAADLTSAKRLELLEEAYSLLQSEVDNGRSSGRSIYQPLQVAVCLLPTVEAIAPDRLEDYFWRVLSLRGSTAHGYVSRSLGRHGPGKRMRLADPVLGAFLSRYDPDQARLLTMTPGDETLTLGYKDAPFYLFGSLAILDPETAVRAVSKLPEGNHKQREAKRKAWTEVLSTLGKSTKQRWEYLVDYQYHYWRPGQVD